MMKPQLSLVVIALAVLAALAGAGSASATCQAGATDTSYCQVGPPVVTTTAATNVATTTATLNGTVNPNGATTTCHFEYGLTTNYGTLTPNQTFTTSNPAVLADYQSQNVTANVTGLTPGQTYHFRLVCSNPSGNTNGNDLTLTTTVDCSTKPTATTLEATEILGTSAKLNGSVNPNGSKTTYQFEYGVSTSYGISTAVADAGSDSTVHPVSATVVLQPGTTYHFRVVATNAGGCKVTGEDKTFTTKAAEQGLPPTVRTTAATSVTVTSATLNGLVNPKGTATRYAFQFGTTTAYGTNTPATLVPGAADNNDHAVSAAITGLQPGTTYHFRVNAANGRGLVFGQDETFTTPAAGAVKPKLTLAPTPKRDKTKPYGYKAKGKLVLPAGVSAEQGCVGNVVVKIRRGRRLVGSATTPLKSDCTYSKKIAVTKAPQRINGMGRKQGRLHVRSYFAGNGALGKANSPKRDVAYGKGRRKSSEFQ